MTQCCIRCGLQELWRVGGRLEEKNIALGVIEITGMMRFASDFIHPTPKGGQCRVRIFLPDRVGDAPVIIVGEHLENAGETVTNSIERIVAEVVHHHDFSDLLLPAVIEHHPPETTDGEVRSFEN